MTDIDAEFRKFMGIGTSNKEPETETVLTMDILRDAMRKLPPAPPQVKFSKHVPALGTIRPKADPITDDMRKMAEDIGEQLGPVAWCLKTDFGDVFFINPVNVKNQTDE